MGGTILVVDDDRRLLEILKINLGHSGYAVNVADNGRDALALVQQICPDVVVLDVTMSPMSGLDVCKTLREEPGYPDCSIIMLTALGEMEDRGRGFEAGADDYLVKPFDVRELEWRIAALSRRLRRPHLGTWTQRIGSWMLHPGTLEVETRDRKAKLTRTEFTILLVLAESAGNVVAPETLLKRLWGEATDEGLAALRVHINRLRQNLETTPSAPRHLRTVRGAGYVLAVP